ncbi:MAG TPA: SpoIIE family protein phosphatase [Pyrinomonadaceae bacterium]|nr:SpoIIE family protein phosphatase [Pyrinomonadaceae bacterium]
MALRQIEGETFAGEGGRLARARAWLRRVMPRVAIAAAVLLIARMLLRSTFLFGDNVLGGLLEFISSCLIFITVLYYGLKTLRWMKRRLLWRVRRRLVVTYLFVGLTPIILLALFGMVASFGTSGEAMSRIVSAQMNATSEETARSAQTVTEAFSQLPAAATDQEIQTWLVERTRILQGSLPGARLALWRGLGPEDAHSLGEGAAQFTAVIEDDSTRPLGPDKTPVGDALPEWLRGKETWHNFVYVVPEDEKIDIASASFRALVRGTSARQRPFALLLMVPVNRALVERYRETTGIYVRPLFGATTLVRRGNSLTFDPSGRRRRLRATNTQSVNSNAPMSEQEMAERAEQMFTRDQLGETVPKDITPYLVINSVTDWETGRVDSKLSFIFDWSWAIAGRQFLGRTDTGQIWWQILKVVSIIFLVLEVLALLAAAWMTRAVTSSVHKLYRATEYIKRGDFSYRVKVRSHDQLGELAGSFNDMAANIESLLQERVERERLEREVELAHEVQSRLFPSRVPDLLTLEAAAECRAARGVAGDYYDYVEVAPGLVAFALGDVSGKGMSASLVMSNLQATLRAQAAITSERLSIAERAVAASASTTTASDKTLARVVADAEIDGAVARKVTNINTQLCQSTDDNRFVTLFLTLYEDRTRTLRYTNAGHNAPILVRSDGRVERLTTGGMMVGAFDWATYEEGRTELGAGDVLVIYSDGITEAEREPGEEYGEERLIKLVKRHRQSSSHKIREAIFEDVDAWTGQKERGDDQTLVIMKSQA